jgi:hypothetical protein
VTVFNGRRKPKDDEKEEALVVKPPTHAVPFSDEWLAAFEAAGEVYEFSSTHTYTRTDNQIHLFMNL